MKIETNVLEDFLDKIQIGTVETCLLNFSDEGLVIKTASLDKSAMSDGLLKKEAFKEYTALGEIGVDNLTKL